LVPESLPCPEVVGTLTVDLNEKLMFETSAGFTSEGFQMYVLLLIGYTVYAGTTVTTPVQSQIGYFTSKGACTEALANYNPGTDLKNVTPMGEYRWALLCLPAGTGLQNH
jgi:hypothetical protein